MVVADVNPLLGRGRLVALVVGDGWPALTGVGNHGLGIHSLKPGSHYAPSVRLPETVGYEGAANLPRLLCSTFKVFILHSNDKFEIGKLPDLLEAYSRER